MPATAPTVLALVMDAIAENLATILNVAGTAPLFGGPALPQNWNTPDGPTRTARIFFQGEPAPKGGPFPLCVINFEDEEFGELDQTTKRGMTLPWSLDVYFDLNPTTEPDAHPTLRDMHTTLIGLVKDRLGIEANRRLPTVANPGATPGISDNTYDGGGAALTALDPDAEGSLGSARYMFTLNYRLVYRHDPGDSKTPS